MTWPFTSPTYGEYLWFATGVGLYLDYGADDAGWDEEQAKVIDWVVQQGMYQFYNPPLLPGQSAPYIWSFLWVVGTQVLVSGTNTYDMPTGFGGVLEDSVTYAANDGEKKLELTDEGTIRALLGKNQQNGAPLYIAVRPKSVVLTAEQVWEMILYPKNNTTKTLTFRYKANHAALSSTNDNPLGTRSHAQTMLYSCYSVAECFKTKANGPMHERFLQQLSASIQIDQIASRGGFVVRPIPDAARQATR